MGCARTHGRTNIRKRPLSHPPAAACASYSLEGNVTGALIPSLPAASTSIATSLGSRVVMPFTYRGRRFWFSHFSLLHSMFLQECPRVIVPNWINETWQGFDFFFALSMYIYICYEANLVSNSQSSQPAPKKEKNILLKQQS